MAASMRKAKPAASIAMIIAASMTMIAVPNSVAAPRVEVVATVAAGQAKSAEETPREKSWTLAFLLEFCTSIVSDGQGLVNYCWLLLTVLNTDILVWGNRTRGDRRVELNVHLKKN